MYYLFIFGCVGSSFLCEGPLQSRQAGPLFTVVRGALILMASLVVEHRLQTRRLSSCGSRAPPLHGMWDLPRPRLEPVSPSLAGRLSTTAPPGKPYLLNLKCVVLKAAMEPQLSFCSALRSTFRPWAVPF